MIDIQFWEKLINHNRLSSSESKASSEYRSVFDMDHDRIIYSNFFRRMHDKTQVFPYAPLSSSGQARSRLSHSLEVSCVARSLGILLGHYLQEQKAQVNPYDIGMIIASACLAHDIGNPPFGHSGEYAIQEWAVKNLSSILSDQWEREDLFQYEGNAQGFRILTRLETWQRAGGIRPTVSTLATFTKYPCSSLDVDKKSNTPGTKKYGYFKSDHETFQQVFSKTAHSNTQNATLYPRHPFAFLAEAADDICYAVVDLEDAFHLHVISFDDVYDFLKPIAATDPSYTEEPGFDKEIQIARLRSATISALIRQVMEVYTENIEKFQTSSFDATLISQVESAQCYKDIYDFSMKHIYNSSRVMEIECAGFRTIGGLLDMFIPAVLATNPSYEESVNRKIIPPRYFKRYELPIDSDDGDELLESLSAYERIMSVTDFISGMTDRYAVELFQRLSGIKLPEY